MQGWLLTTFFVMRANSQNNAWQIGCANVMKISTSERHTLMVTETGTVWYMGEGRRGQGMCPGELRETDFLRMGAIRSKPYEISPRCFNYERAASEKNGD